MNDLGILNTVKSRIPKDDITKLLEHNKFPRDTFVVYQYTNDECETYFMVDWKYIINLVKLNKQNNYFIATMIFTGFSVTLPRGPSSKNIQYLDGRLAPPNMFFCPKVFKIYYKN